MPALTVFHTDDIHAAWNGVPRLAAAAAHLRAAQPAVLVLDGGDMGTSPGWKHTDAVLPLLRQLRWDAVALDDTPASLFGTCPENLKRLRQVCDHALVCNIAPLLVGTEPFALYTFADLRVAVFGTTQPRSDERGQRIDDPDLFAVCGRAVPMLRQEADVVIMVGHLGLDVDIAVAERVPGIDLIVGGDSHHRLVRPLEVNGTRIGHAADLAMVAGRLTAEVDGGAVRAGGELIRLGRPDFRQAFGDEGRWRAELLERVDAAEPGLAEVVATCGDLWGDSMRENAVADYVADRLRHAFGCDLVVLHSHYALPQWADQITRWDLRASVDGTYPYFYHVELTGAQVRRLFEDRCHYARDRERLSPERFAQVESCLQLPGNPYHLSGGRVTVDLNRPPGERVTAVDIGGQRADDERIYRVAVSEIASVNSIWVRQVYHRERKRFDVMALLEEDLRRRGHLEYATDGRLTVIERAG